MDNFDEKFISDIKVEINKIDDIAKGLRDELIKYNDIIKDLREIIEDKDKRIADLEDVLKEKGNSISNSITLNSYIDMKKKYDKLKLHIDKKNLKLKNISQNLNEIVEE